MKEKTRVEDVDRSIYDIKNKDADAYKFQSGLDQDVVLQLSYDKNDPKWMRAF